MQKRSLHNFPTAAPETRLSCLLNHPVRDIYLAAPPYLSVRAMRIEKERERRDRKRGKSSRSNVLKLSREDVSSCQAISQRNVRRISIGSVSYDFGQKIRPRFHREEDSPYCSRISIHIRPTTHCECSTPSFWLTYTFQIIIRT